MATGRHAFMIPAGQAVPTQGVKVLPQNPMALTAFPSLLLTEKEPPMSFINHTQFNAKSQARIDQMSIAAHHFLANLEQLSSLNFKTMRGALAQTAASSQILAEHQEADTLPNIQTDFLQPFNSLLLGYLRSIHEIGSKIRQDMASSLEERIAEFNKSVARGLEQTNAGTAGSETAVNAIMAAVEALNSAYENMDAAGQFAADIIDANASVVTDSAVVSGLASLEHPGAAAGDSRKTAKPRSRKPQDEAAPAE